MVDAKAFVTCHAIRDHQIVLIVWDKRSQKINQKASKTNIKKIHYADSSENIKKINWTEWISQHENSSIDEIHDSFQNIIQECVVFETKKLTKRQFPINPWYTKDLLIKRRKMEPSRKKSLENQM